MTLRADEERRAREVEAGDARYRALVAWRGRASGHGLLYFLAMDGDAPHPDDRGDRRAPLDPGRGLDDIPGDELARAVEEGSPLTETERRFRAPDGRLWLAQGVGPVWSDGDPAEGSTGLLLTALEGPVRRLEAAGGHPGRMDEEELASAWRRASPAGNADDDSGGEADDPNHGEGPGGPDAPREGGA